MSWKKFLSAFILGALIIGAPAMNFDAPFTKTVSAELYGAQIERAKKNYEKYRSAYERARRHYEDARRRGARGAELRRYRVLLEGARMDYENARREYEYYRRVYRR